MTLTLTVLRCPPSVAPEVRQVNGGEFSIGRGPENDWVLPDPAKHLSKRHCVLAYRQGAWQAAGTSTNGTFINRDETPLEAGAPRVLQDGDRLILGVYEIEVRLTEEASSSWGRPQPRGVAKPDPFSNPFNDDPFAPPPLSVEQAPAANREEFGAFSARLPTTFDPLLPDEDEAFQGPTRSDHSSVLSDAINLPPVQSVLPDDWDLEDFAPKPAASSAAPPKAPAPIVKAPAPPTPVAPADSGAAGDMVAAFLRGAGLEGVVLPNPEQAMEQLGAAFRAVVSGLREVLIARAEVKREFRIEATQIRRRGNNLLKFSADDDDALTGLLGLGRRTDMEPEAAITEALTDIRLHELATMAAMQSAVRALVVRLGPEQVREGKEPAGGLGLLGNRKARAWDAYEALHAEVLRGLADDFDSLFGKRFAQAYEQAMQELASQQNRRRDDRG